MAEEGLHIVNTVDNSQLINGIRESSKAIIDSAQTVEQQGKKIDDAFAKNAASAKRSAETIKREIKDELVGMKELNTGIIEQKDVVGKLELELKRLGDAYKDALKKGAYVGDIKDKIKDLKRELNEEKVALINLNTQRSRSVERLKELRSELRENESQMVKNNNALVQMLGGNEKLNAMLGMLPAPIRSVITGIEGMTGAAMAFIATPLGMVLAALGAALALVTTYFKSATDGEEDFVEISGFAKGVMSALKDKAVDMGRTLVKVFKDPIQAAKDFVNNGLNYAKNNFKDLGDIASLTGKIISDIFSQDWSSLKQHLGEYTNTVVRLSTRVGSGGLVSWDVDDTAKAKERMAIEREQHDLEREKANFKVREAEIDAQLVELREKMYSGDANAKIKATAEAEKLIAERTKEHVKWAEKELEIAKRLEANSESTYADKDAVLEAQANLIRTKSETEQAMLMFRRREMSARNTLNSQNAKDARAQGSIELMEKQADAADARAAKQRALQIKEAEIAGWDEGSEKLVAQIKLQGEKERLAIEQQKDDALLRKQSQAFREFNLDPKNKGKAFDFTTVQLDADVLKQFDALIEAANNKEKKALDKLREDENVAMLKFLAEYGDYHQKKQAIAEQYAEKIKKATTDGERKALAVERDRKIGALDFEELKKKVNWEDVFNNLDIVSQKHLETLRDQLQAYIKEGTANGMLSPENAKALAEQIAKINEEVAKHNPLSLKGDTARRFDNRRSNIRAEIAEVEREQAKATKDGNFSRVADLQKQIQKLQKDLDEIDKEEKNFRVKCIEIAESLDKISMHINGLNDLMQELGLEDTGMGKAVANVADGVNSAAGAFSSFVSGDYLGAAAQALSSLKSFGSALGIGGDSDKTLEQDIERLTAANESLEFAIKELASEMKDASMKEATDLYRTQMQNLSDSEKNTREMMSRSGAAYSNGVFGIGGSHSSNKKINDAMSANEWSRIGKAVGTTVNGAGDFWNLTSEQMRKVATTVPDLYAKIKNLANDGYRDAAQYMDDYIEFAKQREELENAYYEKLTNVSFDSFRSEFKKLLTDMSMSSEDFAKNLNRQLVDSIAEALMTEKYDEQIRTLYKNWAKKMEELNKDGELSLDDRQELQRIIDTGRQNIYKQMEQDREFLKQFGTADAYKQEASVKGFQALDQDTGKAIEGRFTAVAEAAYEISAKMDEHAEILLRMDSNVEGLTPRLDAMQQAIATSNIHLADISKYTKNLIAMAETLEEIRDNTKHL